MKKVKILQAGSYTVNGRRTGLGLNTVVELPCAKAEELIKAGAAECAEKCTTKCSKKEEKVIEAVDEDKSLDPKREKKTIFSKLKKKKKE